MNTINRTENEFDEADNRQNVGTAPAAEPNHLDTVASDKITDREETTTCSHDSIATTPPTTGVAPVTPQSPKGRPMQKARFLLGLLFAAMGISLMLAVAVGALQDFGLSGRLSLPAVGICMIFGLMLVGGGFGVMATAAPTFDDDEFDRLVEEGDAARAASDATDRERILRAQRSSFDPRETQRPGAESSVA